jgi:glycosyltransferase involved in cell wall biosynthesis
MSCSACVIGSNTSSIPEVVQRYDSLFDPNSSKELRDLMTKILRSPSLQNELKLHSLKQSSKFSWDKSAKLAKFFSQGTLKSSNLKPNSIKFRTL